MTLRRYGTLFVVLLATLSPISSIFAQELVGVGFFGGSQVKIARIDPATGTPTTLVTTTATTLSGAQAAYDPAQQRVFFQDASQLFTINLVTNAVSQVPEAVCCPNLLFDSLNGQLLGVGFFGGSQVKIARIDPATGTPTTLVTTTATTLSGAQAAYNPAQQRVFFQDASQLFTVNLVTNAVSQVPEAVCCPNLLFDSLNGQLLGVGFFGGSQVKIARIDPATGTPTTLVTTTATTLSGAQTAYDPAQQRVFFQDASQLFTVNLVTNAVSQVPEAVCCASLLFVAPPSVGVPALGRFELLALLVSLMIVGVVTLVKAR
jgi:hypothetical protein